MQYISRTNDTFCHMQAGNYHGFQNDMLVPIIYEFSYLPHVCDNNKVSSLIATQHPCLIWK